MIIKAFFALAFALTAVWVIFLGWIAFLGGSALIDLGSGPEPHQTVYQSSPHESAYFEAQ